MGGVYCHFKGAHGSINEKKCFMRKNKITLSTLSRVFPYYQGESTIFDKGNFLKSNP